VQQLLKGAARLVWPWGRTGDSGEGAGGAAAAHTAADRTAADHTAADHTAVDHVGPPAGVPAGRPVELPGRGRIWVREVPGPPGAEVVVLLHGLGVTGGVNWRAVFPELGATYRVIAVDHRGHGRGIRTDDFDLGDCADDVAALMAVLGVGRHLVVGYSMGGPVAMLLWQRHPELVDGIVLVATSQSFRQRPFERMGFAALALAGALPFAPPAWLFQQAAGWLNVEDSRRGGLWLLSELRRHDPRSILQAAVAIGRFRWPTRADEIDVPVAVIASTQDRVVPVSRQVRMALAIPSAVLHPVDVGHGAFAVLRDSRTVTAISEACGEVSTRARHRRDPAARAAG
jgi:3-oxoadipate enol-lactonase